MSRKKQLLYEIEKYRNMLNRKARTSSLSSKEMIEYSHKLDSLLNEYEDLSNHVHLQWKK